MNAKHERKKLNKYVMMMMMMMMVEKFKIISAFSQKSKYRRQIIKTKGNKH